MDTTTPTDATTTTVEVNFVSKVPDLELPQGHFTVPVTVARYGLSEIVNQLLKGETEEEDTPRPFDFLIEGQFLRSDLGAFLTARADKSTAEKGLTLEVVEALAAPETEEGKPHPDWVSSVAISSFSSSSSSSLDVVTGCYDGVVRVFCGDAMGKGKGKVNVVEPTCLGAGGHKGAIKGVTFLQATTEGGQRLLASCSKDRTVRLWSYDAKAGTCVSRAVLEGHTESVEAVAANGAMLASAGWDKTVQLWNAASVLSGEGGGDDGEDEEEDSRNKKKSKRTSTAASAAAAGRLLRAKLPMKCLDGHAQTVGALVFPHPAAVYSGSFDCSIRQWDTETGATTNVWNGNKAITSLSFSEDANLLASAHEDRHIRVWDPRMTGQEVIKSTLKSHKKWVTSVAFAPAARQTPFLLASCAHDGAVKLWDTRSSAPLQTVEGAKGHGDKALCLAWFPQGLVSGGADCKLLQHSIKG